MKKPVFAVCFLFFAAISACNNSHQKTQDIKRDSVASYKTSRASDTAKPAKSRTDTSFTSHNAPQSTIDSSKKRY